MFIISFIFKKKFNLQNLKLSIISNKHKEISLIVIILFISGIKWKNIGKFFKNSIWYILSKTYFPKIKFLLLI